jgi:hypothetical protein
MEWGFFVSGSSQEAKDVIRGQMNTNPAWRMPGTRGDALRGFPYLPAAPAYLIMSLFVPAASPPDESPFDAVCASRVNETFLAVLPIGPRCFPAFFPGMTGLKDVCALCKLFTVVPAFMETEGTGRMYSYLEDFILVESERRSQLGLGGEMEVHNGTVLIEKIPLRAWMSTTHPVATVYDILSGLQLVTPFDQIHGVGEIIRRSKPDVLSITLFHPGWSVESFFRS